MAFARLLARNERRARFLRRPLMRDDCFEIVKGIPTTSPQ